MKRIMVLAAVVAALMAPSTALAGSSCEGYNPQTSGVLGSNTSSNDCSNTLSATVHHNTSTPTHNTNATSQNQVVLADQANNGSLPFTGLDIGALLVGAVVLVGVGLVVRRITAHVDDH